MFTIYETYLIHRWGTCPLSTNHLAALIECRWKTPRHRTQALQHKTLQKFAWNTRVLRQLSQVVCAQTVAGKWINMLEFAEVITGLASGGRERILVGC
jgi:hypothetical protein